MGSAVAPQLTEALAALRGLCATPARRARVVNPLACVVRELNAAIDPTLLAWRLRGAGEPFLALEVPDRRGFAIAGVGSVGRIAASGGERFERAAAAWRAAVRGARIDADVTTADAPLAPLALGGFAFAADGASSPEWDDFASLEFAFPELLLVREGGRAWLVLQARTGRPRALHDGTLERRLCALAELLDGGRMPSAPLLDPSPLGAPRITSVLAPEHFEESVRRATAMMRGGGLEKVVLARQVRVDARQPLDPLALHCALRELFPSCYCFLVARGQSAFFGASPELLVRREGLRLQTVALAGTARRSADPAVDRHLGERLVRDPKQRVEHEIVARRIAQALAPVALWVTLAEQPQIVRVHNVQHLATPIRAQLREPLTLLELAGHLHPTPAVGGEPRDRAAAVIPALEGLDRGWYAGAIGMVDREGGGELAVALRCALVRGATARLFAGCGIVPASDPADELAETEAKLGALLPLFG